MGYLVTLSAFSKIIFKIRFNVLSLMELCLIGVWHPPGIRACAFTFSIYINNLTDDISTVIIVLLLIPYFSLVLKLLEVLTKHMKNLLETCKP